MIKLVGGKFHCANCNNPVTIFSEDGGKGFRARCKTCKKTYFYPACSTCEQPMWRHDELKCLVAKAEIMGKRLCRVCRQVKERSEFNIKNGILSSRCRTCQSEYFKNWYESTKKKSKRRDDFDEDYDALDSIFGDI